MILRDVPRSISPGVMAQIHAQLAAIRRNHSVTIPFAIESGSRAWGVPSPNSDYDCRFIFVRSVEHYLSPWQHRDVIEMPLADDLDINGWDLGKAIRLLAKGNAVIEWLMSPIVYGADLRFRDEFLSLAHRVSDRNLVARHYLHLGERYRLACLAEGEAATGKKIFYVSYCAGFVNTPVPSRRCICQRYWLSASRPRMLLLLLQRSSRARPQQMNLQPSQCPHRLSRSLMVSSNWRGRRSKSVPPQCALKPEAMLRPSSGRPYTV